MSRLCANAKNRPSAPRASSRRPGRSRPPLRSRHPKICSNTCAPQHPTSASRPIVVGDPDAAFSGAAKIIEAEYEMPFQGHTAFAGAHATADPSNGQMTIYSNDMKSYGMRRGVADVSRHAAGQGARGLDAGPAGLRPHGGGGCGLRGGLDCARDRPAGPHAVDAG